MANEFFPAIGSVAQQTDDLPDEDEVVQGQNPLVDDAEEDRPLQEVETDLPEKALQDHSNCSCRPRQRSQVCWASRRAIGA